MAVVGRGRDGSLVDALHLNQLSLTTCRMLIHPFAAVWCRAVSLLIAGCHSGPFAAALYVYNNMSVPPNNSDVRVCFIVGALVLLPLNVFVGL